MPSRLGLTECYIVTNMSSLWSNCTVPSIAFSNVSCCLCYVRQKAVPTSPLIISLTNNNLAANLTYLSTTIIFLAIFVFLPCDMPASIIQCFPNVINVLLASPPLTRLHCVAHSPSNLDPAIPACICLDAALPFRRKSGSQQLMVKPQLTHTKSGSQQWMVEPQLNQT